MSDWEEVGHDAWKQTVRNAGQGYDYDSPAFYRHRSMWLSSVDGARSAMNPNIPTRMLEKGMTPQGVVVNLTKACVSLASELDETARNLRNAQATGVNPDYNLNRVRALTRLLGAYLLAIEETTYVEEEK